MLEEIKTEKIVHLFKGAEWILEMNSSDIIEKMKDMSFPSRTKGSSVTKINSETVQRRNSSNEWYDYELKTPVNKTVAGTDMSNYRPIIDGHEYTWGELKKFPKELLQVKLYRYWLIEQKYGEEE